MVKVLQLAYPHQLEQSAFPETVAAIGFFDGVHQGHQAVIKEAVHKAKETGKESAVITFHPHPSVVLKKSVDDVKYITPIAEKEQLLDDLGVDRLYLIKFDTTLSQLTPADFIKHFIITLNIKHLVGGFDYTFGHKGAGNMNNIQAFSEDQFTSSIVEEVVLNTEKISSTAIRAFLDQGNVEAAAGLLGRPYEATGEVIKGDQRGRLLGFPTANLKIPDEKWLPKQGVYAVEVILHGKTYKGMANLGVKPTFVQGELKPTVEVYIFDFDQDIYGEILTVNWYKYIRSEQKFNGVEEIVSQLKADEIAIRKYFNI